MMREHVVEMIMHGEYLLDSDKIVADHYSEQESTLPSSPLNMVNYTLIMVERFHLLVFGN